MPIYEFQCTACRHLFEEFLQKVPARPTAKCPECGAKAKKLISNVGIVFKGAGFYVTDSRTSSVASGPKKETAKEGATATESPASSSSESGTTEISKPAKTEGKSPDSGKSKPASDD